MTAAQHIREAIARALSELEVTIQPEQVPLEHPADISHGDYASGVALQFAKQLDMNPRQLAERIAAAMGEIVGVRTIEVAGPGFINFSLSSVALGAALLNAKGSEWGRHDSLQNRHIVVEYTDPNPFKAFHIGHLMSNTIGESIARLYEMAGASVVRANYQGDVGVHVACALWGLQKLSIHPESADEFGAAYAAGATAYKENPEAKLEIDVINRKIYERSDPVLNKIYDTGREGSLAAFERIYAILGTKFDRYFFESETAPVGKDIVIANPEVFPESDGARVFKGEEYGLHTRVFLSSKGLPTYEAKELGLEKMKDDEFPGAKLFVIVTANEVTEFFKVVKKAMELLYPTIAERLLHIPHGIMKLPEGKMSSRTGSVITGESLLEELKVRAHERAMVSRAENVEELAQDVAVAAIKYQILKQGSTKDIVFDRDRALSLEGDSGPYLQYAHARAHQIVEKAGTDNVVPRFDESEEPNDVVRLIHRFPEVVARAAEMIEPHIVTNYLVQLAAAFNSWYAQEQILDGTPAAAHKVAIVDAVRATLEKGLWVLGIPAPEKM